MSQTTADRWVRLQDGDQFVGELWPGSDKQQRQGTLISVLWSGKVPVRAHMTAKPRTADLRPALPLWERQGALGTSVPIPHIENVLITADPRTVNVDMPAGRIVISAFIANDGRGLWAPFFPGGLTTADGRFIVIECNSIEFDRDAAREYVAANLLPVGAVSPAPNRLRRYEAPVRQAGSLAEPRASELEAISAGIRTNRAAAAEDACRGWIEELKARPIKNEAFVQAQAAVKEIGLLSRKAFERAWANSAPADWKHGGRRRKSPPQKI